jgi:hypothetical protein
MQQTAQPDVFNLLAFQADALGQPAGVNGNPPGVLASVGVFKAQNSGDAGEFGDLRCSAVTRRCFMFD